MITDTKSNTHNHRSTNRGLTQDASFSQQELEEDLLETLYGWWYVKNGQIDFSHTGYVTWYGSTYKVQNGKVA